MMCPKRYVEHSVGTVTLSWEKLRRILSAERCKVCGEKLFHEMTRSCQEEEYYLIPVYYFTRSFCLGVHGSGITGNAKWELGQVFVYLGETTEE